ncbi:MAG TPA: hypothetical protein VHV83_17785 [Armatimonadota bacterium]|nr:hypothetical protein [Armatimonadota bacterium]
MDLILSLEWFDSRTDGEVVDACGRPVEVEIEDLAIKYCYAIDVAARRRIATMAQDYIAGAISRQTLLIECIAEQDDERIKELANLVKREPREHGFFTLMSRRRWKAYHKKLQALITILQQEVNGDKQDQSGC